MRTIRICKGEPNDCIEDGMIEISGKLPEFRGPGWQHSAKRFYEGEAERIFAILRATLPQATRHALVRVMLDKDPSFYVRI